MHVQQHANGRDHDNANLTIEISTNDKAGRGRRYAALPALRVWDVNATIGDDGVPHVHRHRRHRHPLQDLRRHQRRRCTSPTCPGYKLEATSTHNEFTLRRHPVRRLQRHCPACCCQMTETPTLLFAKYAASLDSSLRPLSTSAARQEVDREFGSQNPEHRLRAQEGQRIRRRF